MKEEALLLLEMFLAGAALGAGFFVMRLAAEHLRMKLVQRRVRQWDEENMNWNRYRLGVRSLSGKEWFGPLPTAESGALRSRTEQPK